MGKRTVTQLPFSQRRLATIGENLRLARVRRNLTAKQISERAGIDRTTLYRVERGDASVSLGAYVNVLICLGLDHDLEAIGRDDVLGRELQDAKLSAKRRAPKTIKERLRDGGQTTL